MPAALMIPGACPYFFRMLCLDAYNGSGGYAVAGLNLAKALGSLLPDDIDSAEWSDQLSRLASFVGSKDDRSVLGWFDDYLPRCMALIPDHRRRSFVEGLYVAARDGLDFANP